MSRTAEYPREWPFPLAVALYAALALYFLPVYLHSVDPDGISYILLARKYATGDFWHAVNATWQPLFSWLLAPALALGADPMLAGHLLLVACGILTLFAVRRLSRVLPLGEVPSGMLAVVLVPAVLQFTYVLVTPDLLLCALMLFYFSVVFRQDYPAGRGPFVCGLLGGLAFLTKAYALPFFLAHFALMNAFCAWRSRQARGPLAALCAGYLGFLLIAAPWIALVSSKYGSFTVSSAGSFNWAASLAGGTSVPPGFFPPPNPTAVSVWEDPGSIRFCPIGKYANGPVESQARSALKNTKTATRILDRFSPITLAVLIMGMAVSSSRAALRSGPVPAMLASACLFIAGYLPVNVEVRYIWPALLLIAAAAFVLLAGITGKEAGRAHGRLLLLMVSFAFIAWPMSKMSFAVPKMAQLQKVCRLLERQGVRGRIASSDAWIDSLYISFFLGSSYYGKRPQGMGEDELRRQLQIFGIEYYFVWQPGPVPRFLRGEQEIDAGRIRGLRVFKLRGGEAA